MKTTPAHKLAVLSATAIVALGSAGPAAAGGDADCNGFPSYGAACSHIWNHLRGDNHLKIAKNWCGDGWRRDNSPHPPCGQRDRQEYLAPGGRTAWKRDWDAFRVEKGCTVGYTIHGVLGGPRVSTASKAHLWIRVLGWQVAVIHARWCR